MSPTEAPRAHSAERLIELEEAERQVLGQTRRLPEEALEVEHALGRVLAGDVLSTETVPDFDSSAMDGYAVRAGDTRDASAQRPALLRLVAESRAGTPASVELGRGEAVAISTGGMIPQGADAVVRVEDTCLRGERVEVLRAVPTASSIRRAGEDMLPGQTVLRSGAQLGPAELGALASLGSSSVHCTRRPRLSLLVTGDELLGPGAGPRLGGVRDSNSLTISSLAERCGAHVTSSARVGDDAVATRQALAEAAAGTDVMVVCGGVSVGRHDHVRPALAELGADERFWRIALRPGKPTWFGTLGDTLVFGLPGNPVSAMVTFVLLVRPALRAMLGIAPERREMTALMDHDYEKAPGRAEAVRCILSAERDGWHVRSTGAQGSHVLSSMLGADVLAVIPTETTLVEAGERVRIEPLRMWVEGLG
jgi:molybdopterin molybdotransferase